MDLDVRDVERTMEISQGHVSLDAPVPPGDDHRLLDYLSDTAWPQCGC